MRTLFDVVLYFLLCLWNEEDGGNGDRHFCAVFRRLRVDVVVHSCPRVIT
jgi:hypothetical protein